MRLSDIQKCTGTIELVTGLHIGSGNTEMHIGGTDNPVVKSPITQEPYIPGSSIKGKMRSLLEWELGIVSLTEGSPLGFGHIGKLSDERQKSSAKTILKLFGGAPEKFSDNMDLLEEIGPTRLAFWDCSLEREWVSEIEKKNILLTETKMENSIDRIKGVAQHPRNTERVPAGARFDFNLTLRIHDGEDLLPTLLKGLRLLELTGLGGSGSRGYGKIRFVRLELNEKSLLDDLQKIQFSHSGQQ